ncbi:MAG: hybrid sensor histidine kinase/response regulator [Aggregatilineales bacterium]
MSHSTDSDLLSIFRDEVSEYLSTLNSALLQSETSAVDGAVLRELNRVAHSMKGAARAVGLKVIETLAHYMEDVFDAALGDHLGLSPDVCDLLYDGLDLIQNILDGVENDQQTVADVLARLEQVVAASAAAAPSNGPPAAADDPAPAPAPSDKRDPAELPAAPTSPALDAATVAIRTVEESIRVPVSKLDRLMAEVSELLVARMQSEERQQEVEELRRVHGRWRREWQSVRGAYIRLARHLQDGPDELRDDLATLFKFLETNQRRLQEANYGLTQLAQALRQDNLRLTTLTDQLQDDIGGMRLVAFDTLLGGFQRIVRDLAHDTGKQVHLEVTGAAVEIDKTVLDALRDPIMHLLRNAVDHGIEPPDERKRQGKPPSGRVLIDVEQRGSEIVVRVRDDGRGIDAAAVRQAAVRQRILSKQEAELISDDEARSLIFHPGLTTSAQVTAISGRGIGMDIVRDRVESLRGRLSVQSAPGSGTTISLSVPVSLTRIRCVLLQISSQTYAIPSTVVARMVRLPRASVFTAENRDMVVIDGQPMPLVALADVLGLPVPPWPDDDAPPVALALVLRAADRVVAFEVDDLASERELVLKPLGPEIASARFVSGAALLGTGAVIIVLDANDLVRAATGAALTRRWLPVETQPAERRLRVLVVDDSITTRTLEKNILETAGFDVTVAIDGVEGWARLNEADYDVVISDVEMPNMNGLELTRQIKSASHTRDIPVILLTSLSKPEQQQAGLQAGADAYLVKSRFDQGELLKMIWAVV